MPEKLEIKRTGSDTLALRDIGFGESCRRN